MSRPMTPLARCARSSLHLRKLHSAGRQTPNPGQGGSPSLTSISPNTSYTAPNQPRPPLPGTTSSNDLNIANADPSLQNSLASPSTGQLAARHQRKFTPKGKLIPHRPARTIPVTLPSGYPEPTTYPPPAEYFVDLESKKTAPHPLWQFFHVTEKAKAPLTSTTEIPVIVGSLDVEGEGEGEQNLMSGE